jgi:putative MATE family efflux protein
MAVTYLRISALGLPFAMIALAGQGFLRGIGNLRRPLVILVAANAANVVLEVLFVYGFGWGIVGSAWGTVLAQAGMGAAFVYELLRVPAGAGGASESRRPRWGTMRPLLKIGGDIAVRTGALLLSFALASAVVARMGDAPLAAHQVAFQLFIFLALVLDAIAIAGQIMVGRSLGAGDAQGAYAAAVRMIFWSVAVGALFAAGLLAGAGIIPRAFTGDPAVIEQASALWPLFVLMQPIGAAVFALDGILIGASDTRFLKWSMVAALAVFAPLALAALSLDLGVVGVWIALSVLMAVRLFTCGARFVGRRWAVVGV